MKTIQQKIKQYPSMKLITDDGTNAMVVTDNYNDGSGNKVKAILVYKNDTDDYKYGKPVAVFSGINVSQIVSNSHVFINNLK